MPQYDLPGLVPSLRGAIAPIRSKVESRFKERIKSGGNRLRRELTAAEQPVPPDAGTQRDNLVSAWGKPLAQGAHSGAAACPARCGNKAG